MKRQKQYIFTARIMSMLFTPFYLPIVGIAVLFTFSYLSIFPWSYKIQTLLLVYLFTILLPSLLIHLYRHYQGWNLIELGQRQRRMVPYIISILCYLTCIYVMECTHMPHFMSSIMMAALAVQIVCASINLFWKISTHTAAVGGVGGALFAFSLYLSFNPVWWLCLVFLIGGLLGTSRMILRQHTLAQVVVGFWIGFICAALAILFL